MVQPVLRVRRHRLLEALDHPGCPRRPEYRDWSANPAHPAHHQEVGEVRCVVGMQMRDEDSIDRLWRHRGLVETQRRSPAGVDHDAGPRVCDWLRRTEDVSSLTGYAGYRL